MANTFQIKGGTDLSNAGTPAAGEPVWNSSTNKPYIGDGSTAASSLSQVGSEFLPLAGGTLTGSVIVANTSADLQATFGANNEVLDDTYIRIMGRNTANSSGYNFDIGMDADTVLPIFSESKGVLPSDPNLFARVSTIYLLP